MLFGVHKHAVQFGQVDGQTDRTLEISISLRSLTSHSLDTGQELDSEGERENYSKLEKIIGGPRGRPGLLT